MEVRSLAKLSNCEAARLLRIPQAPLLSLKLKTRTKVLPRLPPNSFKAEPRRKKGKLNHSMSVSGLKLMQDAVMGRKQSVGAPKVVRLYTKRTSLGVIPIQDHSTDNDTNDLSLEASKEPLALSFVQIHRETPKLTIPKFMFREYDKGLRERLDVYIRLHRG